MLLFSGVAAAVAAVAAAAAAVAGAPNVVPELIALFDLEGKEEVRAAVAMAASAMTPLVRQIVELPVGRDRDLMAEDVSYDDDRMFKKNRCC